MPEKIIVESINPETEIFRVNINEMLVTDNISELFFIRRRLIQRLNQILFFKLKYRKVIFKRGNEQEK